MTIPLNDNEKMGANTEGGQGKKKRKAIRRESHKKKKNKYGCRK